MGWFRLMGVLLALVLTVVTWGGSVTAAEAHGDGIHKDNGTIGEKCIRDKEYMRRNHMNLLMHKRETTVRDGVRTPDESLLGCKDCHTSRTKFCDRCHTYVGVKPDCFQCHNYPE